MRIYAVELYLHDKPEGYNSVEFFYMNKPTTEDVLHSLEQEKKTAEQHPEFCYGGPSVEELEHLVRTAMESDSRGIPKLSGSLVHVSDQVHEEGPDRKGIGCISTRVVEVAEN